LAKKIALEAAELENPTKEEDKKDATEEEVPEPKIEEM